MKIDVLMIPGEEELVDMAGMQAVAIDVLRFTTTAAAYLQRGAARIIAAGSIQEAQNLRSSGLVPAPVLLAGEREAQKIPGFDFGNSPLEFTAAQVENASVIMTTTNGTRAVQTCRAAAGTVLACLRNARAVAAYLGAQDRDTVLVPAGLRGRLSLEDLWCAGLIVSLLPNAERSDGALTAAAVHQSLSLDDLRTAEHSRVLSGLGLDDDIAYCLTTADDTLIPVVQNTQGWLTGLDGPLRAD